MKTRAVVFAPEAQDDLFRLYDWIAEAAGADTALSYVERLEAYAFLSILPPSAAICARMCVPACASSGSRGG